MELYILLLSIINFNLLFSNTTKSEICHLAVHKTTSQIDGVQNHQELQLQSQPSTDESMVVDIEGHAGLTEELGEESVEEESTSEYYEEVNPVQEQEVRNSTSEEEDQNYDVSVDER